MTEMRKNYYFGMTLVKPGHKKILELPAFISKAMRATDLLVESSSPNMLINSLRVNNPTRTHDLLMSRSALPAGSLDRSALDPVTIEGSVRFALEVINLTSEYQNFKAILILEPVESERATGANLAEDTLATKLDEAKGPPITEDDLEEDASLLAKCWSWFKMGIEVAISDRKMASEKTATIREMLSPARTRDSFRRLVSDFVDVIEIPLEASVLYWKQIAELARGEDRRPVITQTSLGVGPIEIPPRCKGTVPVEVMFPFRPTCLRLVGNANRNLKVIDVMSGKDSLLLSASPLVDSEGRGIYIGGIEFGIRPIEIVVENPSSMDTLTVQGILDGERREFTSEP